MSYVFVLERVNPGSFVRPNEHFVGAFHDLSKALDRRRTKMHENVDWRPLEGYEGEIWTTQNPDYTKRLYAHYRVTRVALT